MAMYEAASYTVPRYCLLRYVNTCLGTLEARAISFCARIGMCTQDKDTNVRIPQLGYHDILLITEMAHARPLLDIYYGYQIRQDASRKSTGGKVLAFLQLRTLSGVLLE